MGLQSVRHDWVTELNEDNGDLLQKVLCMHCHIQCTQPCSRSQPTHASARDSCTLMGKSGLVSCGVTAFFSLVLVHTRVVFIFIYFFFPLPSKSLFPQSCVSFGGSMVRLMVTSSKRAYAILRSTAPRAPAPAEVYCWPVPPQETLKHSSGSVSVGFLGPGAHKVCLSSLRASSVYGVWFYMQFYPSCCLVGASSLPLDVGYLFFVGSNILL